jgi:hypothetical protein
MIMNHSITKRTELGVSVYGSYVFMGLLHLVLLRFFPGPFVPLSKVLLMPLLIVAVYRQTTGSEHKTTAIRMLIGALLMRSSRARGKVFLWPGCHHSFARIFCMSPCLCNAIDRIREHRLLHGSTKSHGQPS